jgi:hypothetical protein
MVAFGIDSMISIALIAKRVLHSPANLTVLAVKNYGRHFESPAVFGPTSSFPNLPIILGVLDIVVSWRCGLYWAMMITAGDPEAPFMMPGLFFHRASLTERAGVKILPVADLVLLGRTVDCLC